jgi:D-alanine-D-alanine ligase
MKNLRVAVLRGGPSEEYDVSLMTGRGVLDSLQRRGTSILDVLVNKQGEWNINGFIRKPEEALAGVDVVFIALHGPYGEDGTVQRILDRVGVAYTGSRAYPSAIAMNKILTKDVLRSVGVKMPAHMRVSAAGSDIRRVAATIESLFGPSYVVKPITGGSSIGTVIAHGVHELVRALQIALATREDVMVEELINGREATVGVVEGLRGQDHYVLPTIEIVPPPAHGFFDYEVKYNGQTEEICPGRFSESEKTQLSEAALGAHRLLGLSQYSRSDFIVDRKGDIYFLETNTLPGLTKESLIPKALSAVGHSYDDFIWHLVSTAK